MKIVTFSGQASFSVEGVHRFRVEALDDTTGNVLASVESAAFLIDLPDVNPIPELSPIAVVVPE